MLSLISLTAVAAIGSGRLLIAGSSAFPRRGNPDANVGEREEGLVVCVQGQFYASNNLVNLSLIR